MFFLVELAFLGSLAYFGLKEPVKKKQLREGIAFCVFFTVGAVFLIMQTKGIKMPYAIDEINKFFKYTLHLSFD